MPGENVNVSTEKALTELQEIADRLLESCGPVDEQMLNFLGDGRVVRVSYFDRIHALIDRAQKRARYYKTRAVDFFKQFDLVRRAQFIISKLSGIDFHALVTRIRLYFSRLACIRVPLFEYGPELAGYRHRFR